MCNYSPKFMYATVYMCVVRSYEKVVSIGIKVPQEMNQSIYQDSNKSIYKGLTQHLCRYYPDAFQPSFPHQSDLNGVAAHNLRAKSPPSPKCGEDYGLNKKAERGIDSI